MRPSPLGTPRRPLRVARRALLAAVATLTSLGALATAGCTLLDRDAAAGEGWTPPPPRVVDPLLGAFGFRLLDAEARGTAGAPRTVIVSPLGAGLALGVALEGAGGATRDTLAAVLGFGTASDAERRARVRAAMDALAEAERAGDERGITLGVANALWAQHDVAFDRAVLDAARTTYRATVDTLDFRTPAAVARINAWAAERTGGRIPTLLDESPSDSTVLVLTNAVYLTGRWARAFDASRTRPAPFLRADGTPRDHPRMAQEGTFGYAAGDGVRMVRLPYRGGRFALYVVLPDRTLGATPGAALDAARARLTPAAFEAAIGRLQPTALAVELPRVAARYTAELRPPLERLGAGLVFHRGRADFRPMLAPAARADARVWIDRAVQQVVVDIDEQGTVAAAATALVVESDSAPPPPLPFVVDRPFLFVLRDDRSGVPLFVGQVVDP